jgi:hypothetical protein
LAVRARSTWVRVGDEKVRVASLEDIIKSKRAAGRKKDLAALPTLLETLREKRKTRTPRKSGQRVAFERASRRMELDLIRERLAPPPEDRMDFLRVRLPGGGSAL